MADRHACLRGAIDVTGSSITHNADNKERRQSPLKGWMTMNANEVMFASGTADVAGRIAAALLNRGYTDIRTARYNPLGFTQVSTRPAKDTSKQSLFWMVQINDGDDTLSVGLNDWPGMPACREGIARSSSVKEYVALWQDALADVVGATPFKWPYWTCKVPVALAMFVTPEGCARVLGQVELVAGCVFEGFDAVLAGDTPALAFARARDRAMSVPNPVLELR